MPLEYAHTRIQDGYHLCSMRATTRSGQYWSNRTILVLLDKDGGRGGHTSSEVPPQGTPPPGGHGTNVIDPGVLRNRATHTHVTTVHVCVDLLVLGGSVCGYRRTYCINRRCGGAFVIYRESPLGDSLYKGFILLYAFDRWGSNACYCDVGHTTCGWW